MAKLSNDAIDWIAGREPNSDGEIKFSVLPDQRDEIVAALRAWKANLPISIYLVEDDEGFVRLAAEGQLICRVPANGPKGVALLRLNAALKEIRGVAVQLLPAETGCGTPCCTDPNCEYGKGPLRCQSCGAVVGDVAQTSQVSTLAKLADKWRVQAKQYDEAAKECYDRGDDDEGDMNDIEGSALFRCATELDTVLKSLASQPPVARVETEGYTAALLKIAGAISQLQLAEKSTSDEVTRRHLGEIISLLSSEAPVSRSSAETSGQED